MLTLCVWLFVCYTLIRERLERKKKLNVNMFEPCDYERFFFSHRPICLLNFFFNEQNQLFFSPAVARPSLPESLRTGGQGRGEVSESRPVTNLPSFAMSPLHPKPLLLSLPPPRRSRTAGEPSPPPTSQVRVTAGARGRSGTGPGVADTWGARKRRRRRGRVCGWV